VRTRLKRRLVERSCTELVSALKRRHGDSWPEHVLQGGFNAYEGMRRICEAFCLRPDLELQVLRRATDQARMWPWNRESSKAGLPAATPSMPAITAKTSPDVQSQGGRASTETAILCRGNVARSDDGCADDCGDRSCSGCSIESDGIDSDAWAPDDAAWHASLPFKEALETLPPTSPISTTTCPSQEPGTTSDSCSSQATPGARSSEYDDDDVFFDSSDGEDDEAAWEMGFEMPTPVRSSEVSNVELHVEAQRGFAAAKRAAKRAAAELSASLESQKEKHSEARSSSPWRSTWRKKVLRALGLQLLWPSGDSPASASEERPSAVELPQQAPPGVPADHVAEDATQENNDVEDEEDSEEEERALSSKLVAAVKNAERQAARARTDHTMESDAEAHAVPARSRARHKTVHFASKSEVSFFAMHADSQLGTCIPPLPADYRRLLYTKNFDGPSGHKAKRSSRECRTPEEEEDEEDWEDQCDDIAELMSQQRCCLMWSQAW